MIVSLILPFLEILSERRQKSISGEFNFAIFFYFKHHFSAKLYIGWYINLFILFFVYYMYVNT